MNNSGKDDRAVIQSEATEEFQPKQVRFFVHFILPE